MDLQQPYIDPSQEEAEMQAFAENFGGSDDEEEDEKVAHSKRGKFLAGFQEALYQVSKLPKKKHSREHILRHDVTVRKDLLYTPGSTNPKHKLDVYVPKPNDKQKAPFPVVIHIHGGGWKRGDRQTTFYGAPFIANAFAERGFVCVAISYRLRNYPGNMIDVANAVKWVKENISDWSGDVQNVFVSGHSAGAHLASLLVLHPKYLKQVNIPRTFFKGVIPISGIYTLSAPMEGWKSSVFRKVYVIPTFGKDEKIWKEASPIEYVAISEGSKEKEFIPPFLILNATKDMGLDFDGKAFYTTLQKCCGYVEHHIIESTNHASVTRNDVAVEYCISFMNKQLAKGQN